MSRPQLQHLSEANLPTRFGTFRFVVFRWDDPNAHPELSHEPIALVFGQVKGKRAVPVRIHSECLTSEVFGSLKCDCREQLENAQDLVSRAGLGVILYLRQEGRGIGLSNKIRAYALQDDGADTVEANRRLHLPDDARTYDVAAAMLEALGVASIELLTNNPDKLAAMQRLGIEVEQRIPALVSPNPHSANYLQVKRKHFHHSIPPDSLPENEADKTSD